MPHQEFPHKSLACRSRVSVVNVTEVHEACVSTSLVVALAVAVVAPAIAGRAGPWDFAVACVAARGCQDCCTFLRPRVPEQEPPTNLRR